MISIFLTLFDYEKVIEKPFYKMFRSTYLLYVAACFVLYLLICFSVLSTNGYNICLTFGYYGFTIIYEYYIFEITAPGGRLW